MTQLPQQSWVKICGIRDVETAKQAAEAGADAVGLNFFSKSPRYLSPETAREIVESLPRGLTAVGLFVNHPILHIEEMMERAGLDTLQVHGDEDPEFLAELAENHPNWKIIWARRVKEEEIADVEDDLRECEALGVKLFACLLDPKVDGSYGGTGETLSWKMVARHYDRSVNPPLILAGGLTPENVGDAVRSVEPWGVDVASGVEVQRGVKDANLIEEFINNARQAIHIPSSGPKP